MDAPNVWLANDDETEIIRAREIAAVSLDCDGNVTARLVGAEAAPLTLVGHRAHHDEPRPKQSHRQRIRVLAELSDSSGSHLVRPVRHESGGWQWVSEAV